MNAETREKVRDIVLSMTLHFQHSNPMFNKADLDYQVDKALDRIAEIVKADRPRLTVEEVVEMWIEIKPLHSVTVDYLVESGVSKFNVTVDEKKITDAINAILDGKGK